MNIIKRNGEIENFDINKIANALYKVYKEIGTEKTIKECFKEAESLTEPYEESGKIFDVEAVQDDVELYLIKSDQYEAARAYIKYRETKKEQRKNPWSDMDERQEIILRKYTKKGESKKDFISRISLGKTSLEKIFRNREALWGGRILYAVGRDGNITGSNCYVATDPEDSLRDIYRADYEIARTYSYGGGQGMNLSKIRPKGAKVNNSSNTSPGVMVFAEKYSHTTLNTQQENRRGALMLIMNIDHPDIIDFITAKLDLSKINGANISIALKDDFIKACQNDEEWIMSFETPYEHIEKKIRARDLLSLVSYSAHTMGDPGVVFIDHMNNYHMLSEYDEVEFTATNPCGEQPLLANGSCNLGSINLSAFIKNPFTDDAYFDFERFETVVNEMTWGLDDLLDLLGSRHALDAQTDHVVNWREIGLGIMGLADMALKLKFAYGSKEFNNVLDEIMEKMINFSARASALRAKDKGSFPKYDYKNIMTSEFSNVFDKKTKKLIKDYGLRNSRLLSIAPTGSISNVLGVSGGVEPFYSLGYNREIKSIEGESKVITVFEKTPKELAKFLNIDNIDELPDWAKVTSSDLYFSDRAKTQATIQKYVDTAISSTFNLPNKANVEDISEIYMSAWDHKLKGATVFRTNCAKMGILTQLEEDKDNNPAESPSVEIEEKWVNKQTGEVSEFMTHVHPKVGGAETEKIEKEVCPVCGDVLIKKGGCTQCRNEECVYEKCAI